MTRFSRLYYETCERCGHTYHREEAYDAGIPGGYCSDQCAENDHEDEDQP